jgi:diaminopimelate decarboxylase
VTSSELAKEVLSIVEKKIASERSSMEFEMAYQMRVAGERIRFAIKAIDTIEEGPVTVDEISLQLLDALDRLERLDRRFQGRSPVCTRCATAVSKEVRA